jgi:hypothetical protein
MNNRSRDFWTIERRNQLAELASTGMAASAIGAIIGASKQSVLTCCARRNISVAMHTDAELAAKRANTAAREKRKQDKRKAGRAATRSPPKAITVKPNTSQSSVVYRNQLPRLPEMSKNALREMIAQAVRNTAGASA